MPGVETVEKPSGKTAENQGLRYPKNNSFLPAGTFSPVSFGRQTQMEFSVVTFFSGLALLAFVSAAVAFGTTRKKKPDDWLVYMHDAGLIFAILDRIIFEWRRSAKGRLLTIVGLLSAVTALIIYLAEK